MAKSAYLSGQVIVSRHMQRYLEGVRSIVVPELKIISGQFTIGRYGMKISGQFTMGGYGMKISGQFTMGGYGMKII